MTTTTAERCPTCRDEPMRVGSTCPGCLRYEEPEPCPNGCGRTTEDPYGGPCQACWNAVCNGEDGW